MTVAYTLSRRFWLSIVIAGVFFTFFAVAVLAQNTTPAPASSTPADSFADLTFPIEELGGCAEPGSCISFCADPVHYNVCVDFAKKKGFYKADELQAADVAFWQDAQNELGCNTQASCVQLCRQPENHEKCDAYAKKKGIVGGYVDEPGKPEYLAMAREVLGCDSVASCSTFCDDPANAGKCDAFAKRVGLLGGAVQEGPGGCTSAETCKSFCSDPNNFDICRVYAPPETGGRFQGPGGCDSPTGCRSYCEENPLECRSYAPGSNGAYVPLACPNNQYFGPGGACTPVEKTQEATACASSGKYWNGAGCVDQPPPGITLGTHSAFFEPRPDMGNCKTPGECYDYCKANPGTCAGFKDNYPRPEDKYVPSLYYSPGTLVEHEPITEMGNCKTPGECYDYCKDNPRQCSGFNPSSPRPLDTYVPGTYYTPPADYVYYTPPITSFYVTPVYYTPPEGSNYTTPTYYTPGSYYTPSYYTPPIGSNYTTPTYYTPGSTYYTPSGEYSTPVYNTPFYYTPPAGTNYTTPVYYSPPQYTTPYYYTPPPGSNYTTPTYHTPPEYTTPTYYTPPPGYSTPTYYTPGTYTTPGYYTPDGSYTTPSYSTPGYYTPDGTYSYPSPSYQTPSYSYPSPTYGTPTYGTPTYETPTYGTPTYETPTYSTPVQGATTSRNIFELLWQFLFGK